MSKFEEYSYTEFSEEMVDILSSGSWGEFSSFHEDEITNLIAEFREGLGKLLSEQELAEIRLKEYVNTYYGEADVSEIYDGELEFIADQLGTEVETKVVFY